MALGDLRSPAGLEPSRSVCEGQLLPLSSASAGLNSGPCQGTSEGVLLDGPAKHTDVAAKEPLGVKLDSLGPRSCGLVLADRHVCVRPLGAPGLVAEAPRQPSLGAVPAVGGASPLPVLQEQPPSSRTAPAWRF